MCKLPSREHNTFLEATAEKSPGAYFLPEFALSPQGSFLEDTTGEQFLTYRYDDQDNYSSTNTKIIIMNRYKYGMQCEVNGGQ
ncbi:hypothetical protein STEG23_038186 [Scotinomys teguina]